MAFIDHTNDLRDREASTLSNLAYGLTDGLMVVSDADYDAAEDGDEARERDAWSEARSCTNYRTERWSRSDYATVALLGCVGGILCWVLIACPLVAGYVALAIAAVVLVTLMLQPFRRSH